MTEPTPRDIRANPPHFMRVEEVAEYLQVSVDRVHQWRKEGIGPRASGPTNRTLRYYVQDVIDWMRGE